MSEKDGNESKTDKGLTNSEFLHEGEMKLKELRSRFDTLSH